MNTSNNNVHTPRQQTFLMSPTQISHDKIKKSFGECFSELKRDQNEVLRLSEKQCENELTLLELKKLLSGGVKKLKAHRKTFQTMVDMVDHILDHVQSHSDYDYTVSTVSFESEEGNAKTFDSSDTLATEGNHTPGNDGTIQEFLFTSPIQQSSEDEHSFLMNADHSTIKSDGMTRHYLGADDSFTSGAL